MMFLHYIVQYSVKIGLHITRDKEKNPIIYC